MESLVAGDQQTSRRRLLIGGAAATAVAAVGTLARSDSAYGATAPMTIQADSASAVPLTVQGAAGGQDANLTEWRDGAGTLLARVNKGGEIKTRHLDLDTVDQGTGVSPELHYKAANGAWLSGIDWAASVPARDYVVASKFDYPNPGNVFDLIYCSHNGANSPTVGIGLAQPDASYRLQVVPELNEPAMGSLLVRSAPAQTGKPLAVRWAFSDPPLDFFSVNADGSLESRNTNRALTWRLGADGYMTALKLRADQATRRVLRFTDYDDRTHFDFTYQDGGYLTFTNAWTATPSFRVGGDGRFEPLQTIQARLTGIQLPHVGGGAPSGGQSGEIRVGNNKLWVNDRGTWKSIAI